MSKVYLLKTVAKGGKAYDGFVWPLEVGAKVVAANPSRAPECGGGLHGLPNGEGDWSLMEPYPDGYTIVFSAAESDLVRFAMSDGGAKAKVVGEATIEWVRQGFWWLRALDFIKERTGYKSHSATTGNWSHSATTGEGSHSATTGEGSHSATTGKWSHSATTGYKSHSATTGNWSHSATTGY